MRKMSEVAKMEPAAEGRVRVWEEGWRRFFGYLGGLRRRGEAREWIGDLQFEIWVVGQFEISASRMFSKSEISQTVLESPAAIAGVIRNVW